MKKIIALVSLFGLISCSSAPEYAEFEPYQLLKKSERYEQAENIITPQIYSFVVSRVTNKMLQDIPALLVENPEAKIYIEQLNVIDRLMPQGYEMAYQAGTDIIKQSKMLNLVTDEKSADFIIKTFINNSNTPEIPIINYNMELWNSEGNLVKSWNDSIKQLADGSWW